jgi:hypothetical protein
MAVLMLFLLLVPTRMYIRRPIRASSCSYSEGQDGGSLFWRNNVFTRARYPMPKTNHLQKSIVPNDTVSLTSRWDGVPKLCCCYEVCASVGRSFLIRYRSGVHFDVYADSSVPGLLADAVVTCGVVVVSVGGLPHLADWGTRCLGFVFAEVGNRAIGTSSTVVRC